MKLSDGIGILCRFLFFFLVAMHLFLILRLLACLLAFSSMTGVIGDFIFFIICMYLFYMCVISFKRDARRRIEQEITRGSSESPSALRI